MNERTVLLVHGYPFDHTLWDHVAALLEGTVQVLAPDLRGFGNNPASTEEPSVGRIADDLKGLLDQRGIGRAVVAGMSMGGYVALAFAEHYPERLAGLGLISSQPWADSDETKAARRAMIDRVRREGPSCAAQAVMPKMFAAENNQNPDLIRFPNAAAERAGVDGLAWALEAMARRPDRSQVLKNLRVPVLVLHGSQDKFIPVEKAREFARMNPRAEFVEVTQAGHATPLEASAAVANALKALIERSYAPATK